MEEETVRQEKRSSVQERQVLHGGIFCFILVQVQTEVLQHVGTLNQFPNPPIKIKFECFLPRVTSKLNTVLTGAWIGNCELFAAADVDRLHVEKWIPN